MKYLIVAGDSFSSDPDGWPRQLADALGLTLISYGVPGDHWWGVRDFLKSLAPHVKADIEAIVLVHSFFDRMPGRNPLLRTLNIHDDSDTTELAIATRLYYKHINNSHFMKWAQEQWFNEVSSQWSYTKLINLHAFPWSLDNIDALPGGINLTPSLAAISLNELNSSNGDLFNDIRPNHFSDRNNTEIANQLRNIITSYSPGMKKFDLSSFEQKTNKWSNWK
jgi:hypothetical protein